MSKKSERPEKRRLGVANPKQEVQRKKEAGAKKVCWRSETTPSFGAAS